MMDSLLITLPSAHALGVLLIITVALILFSSEKIPLATSSLIVLVSLILLFELFPYQIDGEKLHADIFFSGFGHEALIAVSALMIAGQGLVRTGALEPVGAQLAKLWTKSPSLSLLLTLLIGALLSAFVNNTPIVVLLLPILISVSIRTNTAASSILMPMGFATLIGGMTTTIGTSTNLLVVAVANDVGLASFGMFDFFLPAAAAGGIGIVYLWLIAPRIIAFRQPHLKDTSPRCFEALLTVQNEGFADQKSLREVLEKTEGRMNVARILRGKDNTSIVPLPDLVLREGDRLVVRDTPDNLKEFEQLLQTPLFDNNGEILLGEDEKPPKDDNQQLAEIVIVQGSYLQGKTLNDIRFSDTYKLLVLAFHRVSRWKSVEKTHAGDVTLKIGDVILLQGDKADIKKLKQTGDVLVLDEKVDLPVSGKAPIAIAIMLLVIFAAALNITSIAVSATAGVLLMLLTGCFRWQDATSALNVSVILIIVASLAMGNALVKTGGAEWLAQSYVLAVQDMPVWIILSGLLLIMATLTNIVSNNAAAVIGTPIAISIATQLSMPAEPFVLAVMFGANMSFATPMAYKTNLLVMNAGNYHFSDFLKVGIPLTILMWISFTIMLPAIYGL